MSAVLLLSLSDGIKRIVRCPDGADLEEVATGYGARFTNTLNPKINQSSVWRETQHVKLIGSDEVPSGFGDGDVRVAMHSEKCRVTLRQCARGPSTLPGSCAPGVR